MLLPFFVICEKHLKMKLLFRIIFCYPFFVVLYNFINLKSLLDLKLNNLNNNYIKISSSNYEILFLTFLVLFSLSVISIVFNLFRFFGIFYLTLSLIFYYLFLDADFFVFGMIGGLLLLIYDVKMNKISGKSIKNKIKNSSKSIKKVEIVNNKNNCVAEPIKESDDVASRWREYELKRRPASSRFTHLINEFVYRAKFLNFFKRKVKRSVFPEFVVLTLVICSCATLLIVVNLMKIQ